MEEGMHLRSLSNILLPAVLAALSLAPCIAAEPPAGLPAPVAPEGWGVNIHFTNPQPGEMARFAEAGFRFARMDFFWSRIESKKGEYDFSAYDRLYEELRKVQARPFFILDYGNELYQKGSPTTPEAINAFGRFAQAAALHFKGKGVVWEIWNEPNGTQFWHPTPDAAQYAAAALAVAKAVRGADPGAVILAPGTSGFPWEFLETVFQAGLLEYLDGVSVHPYRSSEPETAATDFTRLRTLIARYAPKAKRQMPIISSEWGYSTFEGSAVNEEKQARYMTRMWLANLASGVNLSIFYDWKEDGKSPKENEHHFGTVRPDLTPKPAFTAAKALIADLNGYMFRHRLAGATDKDWKLLFQHGDTEDIAVVSWSAVKTAPDAAQTPTVRRVLPTDPEFAGLRRLAAIRFPYGSLAVGQGNPTVVRVETMPPIGTKHPKIELRFDRPDEGNAFDSHPEKTADGKDVLVTRVEVVAGARRDVNTTFRPRFIWEGKPLPLTVPLSVTRTDALNVTTSPGKTGLVVRVRNPSRAAFSGEVQLVLPDKSTSRQLVLMPGQDSATVTLPDPKDLPHHVVLYATVIDPRTGLSQASEVAQTETTRFVPFTGLATKPGTDAGFASVLYVENAPQKPVPLSITATPESSPAEVAIQLPYHFDPGWRYLGINPVKPSPIPSAARALVAWIFSDGSGDYLRSRFRDSTGQTFQKDLTKLDGNGWQLVTIPLEDAGAGTSWGGANDGMIHPPLSWESLFLIDSASRTLTHEGTILIAAPVYVIGG